MRIIFFGNTKYSVIIAKSVHSEYSLTSVVTIPDRPVGRKKVFTPSPVKQFAVVHNVPVLEIGKFTNTTGKQFTNADFFLVADYGLILPGKLLGMPKYAALNIHHSLLPKYRGPSPAPTAILNGDKITGVTVIKMTSKVDAGDILAQEEYSLSPTETADSLLSVLNTLGGQLALDVIKNFASITPLPQDESKASFTKRMERQDGFIDLYNPPPPKQLDRMIRAYYPWPNVWTKTAIRGREQLIKFLPKQKLQAEGGKPMGLKDFLNGYPQLAPAIEDIFPK